MPRYQQPINRRDAMIASLLQDEPAQPQQHQLGPQNMIDMVAKLYGIQHDQEMGTLNAEQQRLQNAHIVAQSAWDQPNAEQAYAHNGLVNDNLTIEMQNARANAGYAKDEAAAKALNAQDIHNAAAFSQNWGQANAMSEDALRAAQQKEVEARAAALTPVAPAAAVKPPAEYGHGGAPGQTPASVIPHPGVASANDLPNNPYLISSAAGVIGGLGDIGSGIQNLGTYGENYIRKGLGLPESGFVDPHYYTNEWKKILGVPQFTKTGQQY